MMEALSYFSQPSGIQLPLQKNILGLPRKHTCETFRHKNGRKDTIPHLEFDE
jgi:hypothetical protein